MTDNSFASGLQRQLKCLLELTDRRLQGIRDFVVDGLLLQNQCHQIPLARGQRFRELALDGKIPGVRKSSW